jgi:ankyrin repeat domain-containing protein 50
MLQSTTGDLSLHQFLPMLSALDQDQHMSKILHLDPSHPMFYWIFRNIDFKKWSSAQGSQTLWLSGLPDRNIDQVSSYIVSQERSIALRADHLVLYFFCSSAIGRRADIANFAHTLLQQIVCCSPMEKRTSIIQTFLHSLLKQTSEREENYVRKERGFNDKRSQFENVKNLLNAPANCLFNALGDVLDDEPQRCLSVIIDGLDKVEHTRDDSDFVRGVRAFVTHLQQRTSKVKVLLTSRPLAEIKEILGGLIHIEYDRERQGLPAHDLPILVLD